MAALGIEPSQAREARTFSPGPPFWSGGSENHGGPELETLGSSLLGHADELLEVRIAEEAGESVLGRRAR